MSNSKLGENITREWSEEPYAAEIFNVLQQIKSDPQGGLCALEKLAESGSSLSMMYLGKTYQDGQKGVPADQNLAESWLARAAIAGSIEASYNLAWCFLSSGRHDAAIAEYEKLAALNYAPALFVLGSSYYNGKLYNGKRFPKDKKCALIYLNRAEELGHLYSSRLIVTILMCSGHVLSGLLKFITIVPEYIKLKKEYPDSDRLRL